MRRSSPAMRGNQDVYESAHTEFHTSSSPTMTAGFEEMLHVTTCDCRKEWYNGRTEDGKGGSVAAVSLALKVKHASGKNAVTNTK